MGKQPFTTTCFTAKNFRRSNDGGTIIEFALLAPILFLILVGTVEIGLILFTDAVLEGATSVASRVGKAGFAPSGQTREQYIRSKVNQLAGSYLDTSKITITTLAYSSFANVGQPEPCITPTPCPGTPGVNFVDVNGNGTWDQDMGRTNAGGSGDVVVYRVSYPWPIFTPLMRNLIAGGSGTITLTAVTTVRNEAF